MLRLLLDENFNGKIHRGAALRLPNLDCLRAQSVGLTGADDIAVLMRAAQLNRVLVTHDLKTVPRAAFAMMRALRTMSGVIAVPDDLGIGVAIEDLVLLVECCSERELANRILYLPL